MCRIHLVLVLGSTKGLATTAIIPESIKKKKKKGKSRRERTSPGDRCHSGEIPGVRQYEGRCSVKERRLVYEKKKKKKKKEEEEEI